MIKDNYNIQEASGLNLIVSEREKLEQQGNSKRKKNVYRKKKKKVIKILNKKKLILQNQMTEK